MRSKKFSSEFMIFKKDLTRFAPVWLGLVAWLLICANSYLGDGQIYSDTTTYETIAPIFAPILAFLVFGYLCDARECHMVHSLPIRREWLFGIHVASASVMFLVPVALYCLVNSRHEPDIALYRFLITGTEFYFLFSIMVLCVMLTGRRVGAMLLYLMVQAVGLLLGGVVEALYLPELPGYSVALNSALFSPTTYVAEHASYIDLTLGTVVFELPFLTRILGVSMFLLGISLILYRKRKLEHAGDLLALPWLAPFLATWAGLSGVLLMRMATFELKLWGYLLGAAIGYLAYWMLSKKTARVFTPKIISGLVCLLAAMVGSVLVVRMDPLDLVHHVPAPETVAMVKLTDSDSIYERYVSSDPEVIAEIGKLHVELADHYSTIAGTDVNPDYGAKILITYELTNGRSVQRYYVCTDRALIDRAEWFLSQPSSRFKEDAPHFDAARVLRFDEDLYFDGELTGTLIDLVLEECRAGNMYSMYENNSPWEIGLKYTHRDEVFYIDIPMSAEKLIEWLETNCRYYE